MPGFTTHYILGMKAYNDLPQSYLKFVITKYRWLYQLGLQGPDMFFYNFPILRYRDHRNVGSYMHEHHVNDFFRCAFDRLSRIQSKQQKEEGMAFLCGFICHYVGDSICHPYVYGRIGYDIQNPGGYYHGLHAKLENDIDALLLKKYKKKKPSQFNQAATICLNGMETQFISSFLSACINDAFYPLSSKNHYQVTAGMVHRSIMALRSLNLRHEIWCNPWNKSLASNASVPDLLRRCLAKLSTVFYMINDIIEGSKVLRPAAFERLLSELGNYSYHSGLPCND